MTELDERAWNVALLTFYKTSNVQEAIRAYLDAADDWLPMETAPKDGTRFLAWQVVIADEYDEEDRIVRRGVREEDAVVAQIVWGGIVQVPWNGGMPTNVTYTHWRPLPSPPKEG